MNSKVVDTINSFASQEAGNSQLTFEISLRDFQALMKDSIEIYNLLAEVVRSQKILQQKELAKLTADNMKKLQQEPDPIIRFFMLHAYIRQLIKHVAEGFKARPPAVGSGDQAKPRAISKILLRAEAIVGRVKEMACQVKKEVSFTSSQAKEYIAGMEGAQPSRRDTLRALRRASLICPALDFAAVPGDLRGTKRLILDKTGLANMGFEVNSPEGLNRCQRERIREKEIREIFNLG
jgi:hypothetical protein